MWELIANFVLGLIKSKNYKMYISMFVLCSGIVYGYVHLIVIPDMHDFNKNITDSLSRDGLEVHMEIHEVNKKLDRIQQSLDLQNQMLFELQGKR